MKKSLDDDDRLAVSIDEAARLLDVSRSQIYIYIDLYRESKGAQGLRAKKLGPRRTLIRMQDLHKFVDDEPDA